MRVDTYWVKGSMDTCPTGPCCVCQHCRAETSLATGHLRSHQTATQSDTSFFYILICHFLPPTHFTIPD